MGIFDPALSELLGSSTAVFPPTSFKDYITANGFSVKDTASKISIDAYDLLDSELRNNDTMVFRLGAAQGTGTQFALARVEGRLRDFFLFDEEVFTASSSSIFTPETRHQLLAFKLLPDLTETSLINLGLASGLITTALGIDPSDTFLLPAMGRSTVTFELKMHSTIPDVLTHNKGQVEIDSLFVKRRNGQDTLFIIEAKSNNAHRSLAKHKLVYPILSVPEMSRTIC